MWLLGPSAAPHPGKARMSLLDPLGLEHTVGLEDAVTERAIWWDLECAELNVSATPALG